MAITNGYCTLAELKANLGISDSTEDTPLEKAVEAASRGIDKMVGFTFYAATATKYFTPERPDLLFVEPLISITTLKTDEDGDRTFERTWATTDYDLEPLNATPKEMIRISPLGSYSFPMARKSVEIVGSWGYAATAPMDVQMACLIQAARIFKRKDAPFGTLGSAELGFARVVNLDPDVAGPLRHYRQIEVG